MDVLYPICCGLDVHKKTVTACLRVERDSQIRTFRTVTAELLELADWLAQAGCTQVAMEATGVYWKPVWNLLEGQFHLLLANARHIKAVPGRKTDVSDAAWIAQLLQHGLLTASFVPPQPIRDVREITRHRTKLVQQRSAVINRLQKVLEDANIKLASVASDVMGVSGQAMLAAMRQGETEAETLAALARGKLRQKHAELVEALTGKVRDHHRFLLGEYLDQLAFLEEAIGRAETRIETLLRPFAAQVARLDAIPGINATGAAAILGEVGPDMSQFASHDHIVSWACVCPGQDESAGKHGSRKCRKGNNWLRGALAEAAWAAAKTDTALGALYRRLARKRGKKRAIVAVSRQLLITAYYILRDGCEYHELGADYYDRQHAQRTQRYLIRRLEEMGVQVTVQSLPVAA